MIESNQENREWVEEDTHYKYDRLFRLSDNPDVTLLVGKHLNTDAPDFVTREIGIRQKEFIERSNLPIRKVEVEEYRTDKALRKALNTKGLPELDQLEHVRRSVAATRAPHGELRFK